MARHNLGFPRPIGTHDGSRGFQATERDAPNTAPSRREAAPEYSLGPRSQVNEPTSLRYSGPKGGNSSIQAIGLSKRLDLFSVHRLGVHVEYVPVWNLLQLTDLSNDPSTN